MVVSTSPLGSAAGNATTAARGYITWLQTTNVVYIALVGIAALLVLSVWSPTERFAAKAAACLLLLLLLTGGKQSA
jgi:hypothetical protein